MKVESIAECFKHSAILLTCIRTSFAFSDFVFFLLPFTLHHGIKTIFAFIDFVFSVIFFNIMDLKLS